MDLSYIRRNAALLALVLLATACATTPNNSSLQTPSTSKASTTAALIGNAVIGSQVQLPQGNELGVGNVFVESQYFAASGRECRRLLSGSGQPMARIVCKNKQQQWQFSRDLSPQTRARKTQALSEAAQMQNDPSVPVELASAPANATAITVEEELDDASMSVDLWEALPDDSIAPGSKRPARRAPVVATPQNEALQLSEEPVQAFSVLQNETLWAFAKRTTGNALNWKIIAQINGIENTKAVRAGTLLNIPERLVSSGE